MSLKWSRIRAFRAARADRIERETQAYEASIADIRSADARLAQVLSNPVDIGHHASMRQPERVEMADRLASDWVDALPEVFARRTPASTASPPCVIAGVDFTVARRILSPGYRVFRAMVNACYTLLLRAQDPTITALPSGYETKPTWIALSHVLDALDASRVLSLWEVHYPGTARMIRVDRVRQIFFPRLSSPTSGKQAAQTITETSLPTWRRSGFGMMLPSQRILLAAQVCLSIPGGVPGQPDLSDALACFVPDNDPDRLTHIRTACLDALDAVQGGDVRAWAEASAYLTIQLAGLIPKEAPPPVESAADPSAPQAASGEGGYGGTDPFCQDTSIVRDAVSNARAIIQDESRDSRSRANGSSLESSADPTASSTRTEPQADGNSRREAQVSAQAIDDAGDQEASSNTILTATMDIAQALARTLARKDARASAPPQATPDPDQTELEDLDEAFKIVQVPTSSVQEPPMPPSVHARALGSLLRQIRGQRTPVPVPDGVELLEERLVDLRTDRHHADPNIATEYRRSSKRARVLLLLDVSVSVRADTRLRKTMEQVSVDLSAALRQNRCRLDVLGYSKKLFRYLDKQPPLFRQGVVPEDTRTLQALRYAKTWSTRVRADARTVFLITDGDPTDASAEQLLQAIRDLDTQPGVRVLFVIITARSTDAQMSQKSRALLAARGYPIHAVATPAELYRVLLHAIRDRRFL